MRHLDLFSGIGGFALAAQAAGCTTIGFSEIEPYACKVLKKHWPDIPNYGDITRMRGVECDLITGGFPCQPYSVAGKQRGSEDHRALWPEALRLVAESRPSWFLGENVAGIISMELDRVLSDLEAIGYTARPVVIPACAVDAPHRRDRVWIMAHRTSGIRSTQHGQQQSEWATVTDAGSQGDVANSISMRESQSKRRKCHQRRRTCNCGKNVPDTNSKGLEGQRKITSRTGAKLSNTSNPCRGEPEPGMGRVAHGIPNRTHRLKGLGNAIVPRVAEIIISYMMQVNQQCAT